MADNKVTFGLEKVHVAFKGVAQAEQIEITAPATTDGEVTVTVTATTLLGADSPKTVVVPVASETHTTITKVASAIANELSNDEVIGAVFRASYTGGLVKLTAKTVAANDSTLDITITPGTTGVTAGTSTPVTSGVEGWEKPQLVPGAVRYTPTPQGQESTFYADNGPYFTYTSNNGYTAELEMALVPDVILAEMLGWEIDNNGALIEVSDGIQREFALMGQVQGDQKNRRFVYYSCKASRPAKEHSTKGESVEPATDVLSLVIIPIEVNGKNVVKGTLELSDTNATAYNAFYDSVYLPKMGA